MTANVRADVFPAILTVAPPDSPEPASTYHAPAQARTRERVRVIVTLDSVHVFEDSPHGPRLIFSERLDSYTPPPPRPSTMREARTQRREATLQTDSGKTLAFRQSSGCGCGSRLRSFDPFSTLASTRDSPGGT